MATVLQQQEGVVSFDIKIDGQKIKDTVEIISISTTMEVNRIAVAEIVMLDGGAIGVDNSDFTNSESEDFLPGKKVEILMGYGNERKSVFEGIITSQSLEVKNSGSNLILTCKDEAVKMTKGRLNSIMQEKKDSDAITSLAGNYGLKSSVDSTAETFPILMQYNCSDWDFILVRAEINNMLVVTDKNTLTVKKYNFGESPNFEINASQYIIDISLRLDSENVADKFKLNSWDPVNQDIISKDAEKATDLKQGNIKLSDLADVLNSNTSEHYSSATLSESELGSWGEALSNKAVLSKIQGKITVPGTSEIIAGELISIAGFSDRFNGNAFVSKVEQLMEDGAWSTALTIGRSVQWHSSLPNLTDTFASGIIPPANGTQIAKVKKIHEDPDSSYRVLITLPAFTGTGQEDGIWARLAFPYASAEAGFFFFPEVDDEVIVTFMNNDPRYPVIIGSLYSSKNKPKEEPDEKNQFKSIFSKSGINIRFDDEDKILNIETPDKNTLTLDDKEKTISIKDQNGNTTVMSDSGIEIKSPKDITITADGNVDIKAGAGLNLTATSDAKVEGMNVQLSAKTALTAKGNASAELSASGQTTVKGAMVMIN